jgi:hypothetical protein
MRRVIQISALAMSMLFFCAGCATPVFTSPVSVSTKSEVAKHVTLIQPVSVEKTDYLFVIIPIINDPRKGFDELLQKAHEVGGDCIVDFQIHAEPRSFMCIPLIMVNKYSYSGIAARMDK